MAKYDDVNSPLLFLTGTVNSTSIYKRYEHDDATDLGPSGSNIGIEFEMVVNAIDTQDLGSSETRTGASRNFTGLDVKVGTWLTDSTGEKCLKIISIDLRKDKYV